MTSGWIEDAAVPGAFALRAPTIRATVGRAPRAAAALDVLYLGPSQETAPLASGELRRQIGIELRAQDTCNLVYAMWHISPSSGIHVAVKSNPGRSAHLACHDGGYVTVSPDWSRTDVLPLGVGRRRRLAVELRDRELRIAVDGVAVWRGRLPSVAFAFDGPVGLRSDNGAFEVAISVGGAHR